jgi:hypothetical protein
VTASAQETEQSRHNAPRGDLHKAREGSEARQRDVTRVYSERRRVLPDLLAEATVATEGLEHARLAEGGYGDYLVPYRQIPAARHHPTSSLHDSAAVRHDSDDVSTATARATVTSSGEGRERGCGAHNPRTSNAAIALRWCRIIASA